MYTEKSFFVTVKLIGKLLDGTVFARKGHDEESPFEFKVDEGHVSIAFMQKICDTLRSLLMVF